MKNDDVIFIYPGTREKMPSLIAFQKEECDALREDIAFAEAQGDDEAAARCREALARHEKELELAQRVLDSGVELADGVDMLDNGQMVMEEAMA